MNYSYHYAVTSFRYNTGAWRRHTDRRRAS